MKQITKPFPLYFWTENLKRMRKLQALINRNESNFSLIKSRPVDLHDVNEFFSDIMRIYNYASDLQSSFYEFWHELHIKQIEGDIRFNEEDSAAVSNLLKSL